MLPSILAGPLLRRSSSRCVTVWIALSESASIEVEVFDGGGKGLGRAKADTIAFGGSLHVALVSVLPDADLFPTGAWLNYAVRMHRGGRTTDLTASRPGEPERFAYAGRKLPAFVIHSPEKAAQIVFGSCRKLHGDGEDAMVALDKWLAEQVKPDSWPQALFLTGDQIYADDVAGPLALRVQALGRTLSGQDESIPSSRSNTDPTPISRLGGVGVRRPFLYEHLLDRKSRGGSAGTADFFDLAEADNHLLSFGEYAAMYCLAWNPECWPVALLPGMEPTRDPGGYVGKANTRHEEQRRRLELAFPGVHSARRVLAQVPSSMILDDHEITDDFLIDRRWQEQLRNSALGRRVVCNGLAAYFVFQAWGNDPAAFTPEFVKIVSDYCLEADADKKKAHEEKFLKAMASPEFRWEFMTETNPPALFLDTRTRRSDGRSPVALIDLESRGKQLEALVKSRAFGPADVFLCISPSPLLGLDSTEAFQRTAAALGSTRTFDYEVWSGSESGYAAFLTKLLGWTRKTAIVLSGDVHYSFIATMTPSFQTATPKRIIQITSSALKNVSYGGVLRAAMRMDEQRVRFDAPLHERLGHEVFAAGERKLVVHRSLIAFPDRSRTLTANNVGILRIQSSSLDCDFLTEKGPSRRFTVSLVPSAKDLSDLGECSKCQQQ